jgi:hypothetical protein
VARVRQRAGEHRMDVLNHCAASGDPHPAQPA